MRKKQDTHYPCLLGITALETEVTMFAAGGRRSTKRLKGGCHEAESRQWWKEEREVLEGISLHN